MPVVIVVGIQWGDEGKGKVVDYLTKNADVVVRFQGGSNAGHTLVCGSTKIALRLIPSGILREQSRCLLAAGVVVDPEVLLEEFKKLSAAGIRITPERLGIASECQMILPYHIAIDQWRERALGNLKIGTTGRGIGPAYESAVTRSGIRLAHLTNALKAKEALGRSVENANRYLKEILQADVQFDVSEMWSSLQEIAAQILPFMTDVSTEVNEAIAQDKLVVFEGAQGSLLDVAHGTYPFVTSSSTIAGYACASAGFGPRHVSLVLGICKAYSTRVGSGPFPSEDHGELGEKLRKLGNEFGTVTGRARRCGWFDSIAVRRAIQLSGVDRLIITKLDVLSTFDTLKIGIGYKHQGRTIDGFPPLGLEEVEAQYEELPGWNCNISSARTLEDLPPPAVAFLRKIAETTNCEIGGFSVGPDREQTVIMDMPVVE
jgi:adenylosuccinate synthase